MSDETTQVATADLKLVLRNTDRAARDAAAAFEATERLVSGIGARFDALEGRLSATEARIAGLERRMAGIERGMDDVARSTHHTQQMVADIAAKLG